jgi:hypothetical protein
LPAIDPNGADDAGGGDVRAQGHDAPTAHGGEATIALQRRNDAGKIAYGSATPTTIKSGTARIDRRADERQNRR